MDPSKLKLEAYDLLAVVLPGLIVISEGWIFAGGWTAFANSMRQLSGSQLALLTLLAFAAGNLVQELGDIAIKKWKGDRFFKRARDKYWKSDEARHLKSAFKADVGLEVPSVDAAFDYCLTKLKDRFGKRDVFIAISDLCRSLSLLAVLALVPASKMAWDSFTSTFQSLLDIAIIIASSVFLAWLSWRRMVRLRELSEITVFRSYLAVVGEMDKRQEKQTIHCPPPHETSGTS